MNEARRARLILWCGALLALLIYAPRLRAPWSWDDRAVIQFNDALARPLAARLYLTNDYFPYSREASWRPLPTLTYAATVRALGYDPGAFRLTSLLLHLLVAALLFVLLRALKVPLSGAAAGAALFAVHAVHTETVIGASFNEDLLAAAGALGLALLHRAGRPDLAAAALAAALLSKENAVLAPVLPLALDWASGGRAELRRRRGAYALYAVTIAAYLLVRVVALPGPMASTNLAWAIPPLDRLYFALSALGESFRLFLLPLGLQIEHFALPPAGAADWGRALALAGAAAAAAAFALKRLPRPVAALLAASLLLLVPTSGLLPVEALNTRLLAERFLYLPALGACAAAGVLLASRPALLAAVLAAWSGLAVARAADWGDEARLWRRLVARYPESAKAHEGLGEALFRQAKPEEALASFEEGRRLRAERRDPVLAYYQPKTEVLRWDSPGNARWRGLARLALEREREAEADFEEAARLEPAHPLPWRALSDIAARRGDWAEAGRRAERGLAHRPDDGLLLAMREQARAKRRRVVVSFR